VILGKQSREEKKGASIYSALWYLHRGQRYCGIATFNKELKLITHRGFVRHSFTPEELKFLSGSIGIGH